MHICIEGVLLNQKSVLLVANGEILVKEYLALLYHKCDYIIAVDGGARHLFNIGKTPDYVIGDMDSEVHLETGDDSIKEVILNSQLETDLVKALNWCNDKGFKSIELIGVEGGRSDHILGIYASIVEANISAKIKIHLHDFVVHILNQSESISLQVPVGKIISLFALVNCSGVYITGTKWELNDAELDFATTGIHNQSMSGQIDTKISKGKLAIFVQR